MVDRKDGDEDEVIDEEDDDESFVKAIDEEKSDD